MANTYTQLIIHGVFAVKNRNAVIAKDWQDDLFGYIAASVNEMGHRNLLVNGVADHVHILFGMKPTLSLSDTMRDVKANASKWLNESGKLKNRFEWQIGFGGLFCYQNACRCRF